MATILVLGVQVPFTKGGAEALVNSLVHELKGRGHQVDTVALPFRVSPKEGLLNQIAQWRSLDLSSFGGRKVDLVIGTKFPSYFVKHPMKSCWLVHQHRPMYDLFGGRYSDFSDDPRDENLRQMLVEGDNRALRECQYIAGISRNVSERLKNYNSLEVPTLYPPLPLGARYKTAGQEDYILSVGRLCAIKRVDLMIKALPTVHNFVKLKIVGLPDEPGIDEYYKNEIAKHHLWDRVEFLGRVSDEELVELYSKALAVYYAPHNEDYGYVTLEAFASGKPVLTAHDSGGTLEFVQHERNGLIVEPTTDAIGHALNRFIEQKEWAAKLGAAGAELVQGLGITTQGWDAVVEGLLSPLATKENAR
jgi:glycosyltransferase involved in cell wall biosynthesis